MERAAFFLAFAFLAELIVFGIFVCLVLFWKRAARRVAGAIEIVLWLLGIVSSVFSYRYAANEWANQVGGHEWQMVFLTALTLPVLGWILVARIGRDSR
jgi:hypothetical protein